MSAFDFVPQKAKKFRAKPISEFDWRSYRTVRIEISVGRHYHEGNRLQATMDWAHNNFQHVVVLLGDTLQRYNLMMDGMGADQAYKQSLQEGNEWLERNKGLLQKAEILRWDDIVEHVDFDEAKSKIEILYESNVLVRQEIKKAINEVALRRNIELDRSRIFSRLSENYLLEEIAGAAIANRLYPGISAYPGQLPGLWNIIHDVPMSTIPLGLESARSIELKIYKK